MSRVSLQTPSLELLGPPISAYAKYQPSAQSPLGGPRNLASKKKPSRFAALQKKTRNATVSPNYLKLLLSVASFFAGFLPGVPRTLRTWLNRRRRVTPPLAPPPPIVLPSALTMSTTLPSGSDALGPTYAQIFGPVFWGFCVALILCGVTALQGYLYFTRYNDKLLVKLLASMMLILDFLSMSLISQSIYYYMLPHFGSLAPLAAVTKELVVECLISAIITFTSQMYFVYQLYMVKRPGHLHRIMTAVVGVLATAGLGAASGCVGVMFMHPQAIFMNRNHTFSILAGLAKGFGATADIVATLAMCMFLKSAETGITRFVFPFRYLHNPPSHICLPFQFTAFFSNIVSPVPNTDNPTPEPPPSSSPSCTSSSTAACSSPACQVLLLITFFASSGHLYWLALHINTTKLYVNTFFGMLNARTSLQDKYGTGMSLSSSSASFHRPPTNRMSSRRSGVVRAGSLVIGGRSGADMDADAASVEEKVGDLAHGDPMYALGEIRVTTTSTVAEI
ncbi:hypothetical protein C8J57DRAFT_1713310 [Mycena rebaudengoi]|nr:hypothetical protein C8J57DRAFT_1713310 [Mycena rebaudengoi]